MLARAAAAAAAPGLVPGRGSCCAGCPGARESSHLFKDARTCSRCCCPSCCVPAPVPLHLSLRCCRFEMGWGGAGVHRTAPCAAAAAAAAGFHCVVQVQARGRCALTSAAAAVQTPLNTLCVCGSQGCVGVAQAGCVTCDAAGVIINIIIIVVVVIITCVLHAIKWTGHVMLHFV